MKCFVRPFGSFAGDGLVSGLFGFMGTKNSNAAKFHIFDWTTMVDNIQAKLFDAMNSQNLQNCDLSGDIVQGAAPLFPLHTNFDADGAVVGDVADLFFAEGPSHHNTIHQHFSFCEEMFSMAWQVSGSKLWMIYDHGHNPSEFLGEPDMATSCCYTWFKSPIIPSSCESHEDEMERCSEVSLFEGDIMIFPSALPHFAYSTSPMVSLVHHDFSRCNQ